MRETIITNCEKRFFNKCLQEKKRLDGRDFDEFRPLTIQFGKEWGSCVVTLGSTRVLAQTSCEIQQPKSSRPSEGILYINLELNPIGAPNFEPGRQSETSVELNRLLEKCVKDSKAVDLESLCIKNNEKVWALRVDLNVLNHEGNILDCASVALLASLSHFKRPDVTCDGEEFIIHSHKQRDPIPTVIHHHPVCVTYGVFNGGEVILSDPTLLEEGIADAVLSIGLNYFKELCSLHLGGNAQLLPHTILGVIGRATSRATVVIDQLKKSLQQDAESRKTKCAMGLYDLSTETHMVENLEKIFEEWQGTKKKKKHTKVKKDSVFSEEIVEPAPPIVQPEPEKDELKMETDINEDVYNIESDDDVICLDTPKKKEAINVAGSSSEEEDVVVLESTFSK